MATNEEIYLLIAPPNVAWNDGQFQFKSHLIAESHGQTFT